MSKLMDILDIVWIVSILFLVVSVISLFIGANTTRKMKQKDDNEQEFRAHGKILEKRTESYDPGMIGFKANMPIDQIVFEDDEGNRIRLRNVNTQEIVLAIGDVGHIVYRGETIYGFFRDT